jgi:hypothetical protein
MNQAGTTRASELTEIEYGEKGRSTLFAPHPSVAARMKLVHAVLIDLTECSWGHRGTMLRFGAMFESGGAITSNSLLLNSQEECDETRT